MILRVSTILSEVYPVDLDVWRLGLLDEGLDPDYVSMLAADMGTAVHEGTQMDSRLTEEQQQVNIVATHMQLKEALTELGFSVDDKEVEVTYTSENGVFIGHIDWLATDPDGQKWLLDLKTHGLWKFLIDKVSVPKISAPKKARVNLQTWLYQRAGGDKLKDYKRGVLTVNQIGWEFIELKRPPTKRVQAHAMQVIKNYYKNYSF